MEMIKFTTDFILYIDEIFISFWVLFSILLALGIIIVSAVETIFYILHYNKEK
jgi:hypothetical protein